MAGASSGRKVRTWLIVDKVVGDDIKNVGGGETYCKEAI